MALKCLAWLTASSGRRSLPNCVSHVKHKVKSIRNSQMQVQAILTVNGRSTCRVRKDLKRTTPTECGPFLPKG